MEEKRKFKIKIVVILLLIIVALIGLITYQFIVENKAIKNYENEISLEEAKNFVQLYYYEDNIRSGFATPDSDMAYSIALYRSDHYLTYDCNAIEEEFKNFDINCEYDDHVTNRSKLNYENVNDKYHQLFDTKGNIPKRQEYKFNEYSFVLNDNQDTYYRMNNERKIYPLYGNNFYIKDAYLNDKQELIIEVYFGDFIFNDNDDSCVVTLKNNEEKVFDNKDEASKYFDENTDEFTIKTFVFKAKKIDDNLHYARNCDYFRCYALKSIN